MSFGYEQQDKVYVGDNHVVDVFLYDKEGKNLISFVDLDAVHFTIRKPTDTTIPSVNYVPGEIVQDEDGHGQFVVDENTITESGEYKGVAQFTFANGLKRSVVIDFDVIDPFQSLDLDGPELVVDQVWTRLEDLFDSELGEAGPWLRSQTLSKFDQEKIRQLFQDALVDINTLYNPLLNYDMNSYPYANLNANAVLTQGLLVATIRHLIRSYTEQPDVINSTVGYLDRKRYAEAWAKVLTIEEKRFKEILAMWKRGKLGLGQPAILVGVKAGRLLPATLRTRYAARGW